MTPIMDQCPQMMRAAIVIFTVVSLSSSMDSTLPMLPLAWWRRELVARSDASTKLALGPEGWVKSVRASHSHCIAADCDQPTIINHQGFTELLLRSSVNATPAASGLNASLGVMHKDLWNTVLFVPLLSREECQTLVLAADALEKREASRRRSPFFLSARSYPIVYTGSAKRARVSEMSQEPKTVLRTVFEKRLMLFLRETTPDVAAALFGSDWKELLTDPLVDFDSPEPVVNMYQPGDDYTKHIDNHCAMTLLSG